MKHVRVEYEGKQKPLPRKPTIKLTYVGKLDEIYFIIPIHLKCTKSPKWADKKDAFNFNFNF
jgi:hypothetical protein